MRIRSDNLLAVYKNQSKMSFWAFLAVFLSFILSTFVSLASLKVMSDENSREPNTIISSTIYERIMEHMSKPIVASKTMSKDRFLHDVLANESDDAEEKIKNYLKGLQAGLEFESTFVVSANTKKYYTYDGIKKTVDESVDPHDIWYSLFLQKNRDYDLDVDRDQNNNDEWTIFINTRVVNKDGELVAVCGVGSAMSNIQSIIKELEDYYDVKINLVDLNGLVQVDSDSINIENAILDDIDNRIEQSEGFHYLSDSNDRYRIARYIPNLGWFLVVQNNKPVKNEIYYQVITLNVALFLLISFLLVFVFHYLMKKTKDLSESSFKDGLTRAYNRRAFEKDKLVFNSTHPEALTVIVADLNGLKRVNDTLGHERGDELILGAYDVLEKLFSKYGYIYRTGGDEFVMFVQMHPDFIVKKIEKMNELLEQWTLEHKMNLSISIGYSSSINYPYMTIDDHIKTADEMMYSQKKAFYSLSENNQRDRR